MSFIDPTPFIEKDIPRTKGKALSGGMHGETISVLWQGKTVNAIVKGFQVSTGMPVWVVRVQNRNFAIMAAGGYRSTEPKALDSWRSKTPACEAIRELMKDNPKKYLYKLEKVASYDSGTKTATLSSGQVLPVKFGIGPGAASGQVVANEIGLIWNDTAFRHVIGRELLDLDIYYPDGGIFFGGIPGEVSYSGFYFYASTPIQLSYLKILYRGSEFYGEAGLAKAFADIPVAWSRFPGYPTPPVDYGPIHGDWEHFEDGDPYPVFPEVVSNWEIGPEYPEFPGHYNGGTWTVGTKGDDSLNIITLPVAGLYKFNIAYGGFAGGPQIIEIQGKAV